MTLESFYSILSGICFGLIGLWWNVVDKRPDWLTNPNLRRLAGAVYASFLIPGVMALGAQIGGDNKLVWRSVFVLAALLGIYYNVRLLAQLRKSKQSGFPVRTRWLVILTYVVVLVLGAFPELANPTGLKPIQVEAFLLCLIVLTGHGIAWEMMLLNPAA